MPRFGDQLPSGASPRSRAATKPGSAGVVGKVVDLVGNVVQQRSGPVAAATTAAVAHGSSPVDKLLPIAAAVAGPLVSYALNRADKGAELRATERQQLRESSERLLAGAKLSPAAKDMVELCDEDEDGVASCELVERFTDRATGKLMARRNDGRIYQECERLPNGSLACRRGTKKLVEVKRH